MEKLNWYKLKQSRCPKCGSMLGVKNGFATCVGKKESKCDFTIGEDRMADIVANLVTQDLDSESRGHFREEGWG